ncbi:uncharacterized protein KQ657_003734 [Scheffersomyces spartinae]|uniref:Uncharacterized protein n=1 Tax=Scheffersomyces spartinae TaxID=45513 RepID=A0A9P8AJ89_9ASCO|nr:uncharacterized protein KQ657_003734 [Scheffersomyces spartinae]KAG7195208.1 hypothetical protein KQ657_003734 [Scheffersomyces spartinae]
MYDELDRMKIQLNILRNDMLVFIQLLATIPSDLSQQQYFNSVKLRLFVVQQSIKEYCAQYNKLLPIINLAQIRLGNELEIVAPTVSVNGNGMATPATINGSSAANTPSNVDNGPDSKKKKLSISGGAS